MAQQLKVHSEFAFSCLKLSTILVYLDVVNVLCSTWLVGRLTSSFSIKIGYIGDKILGGDLVPTGLNLSELNGQQ